MDGLKQFNDWILVVIIISQIDHSMIDNLTINFLYPCYISYEFIVSTLQWIGNVKCYDQMPDETKLFEVNI